MIRFAASFAERVIMLKDGQIHTQPHQEGRSKQAFYEDISTSSISIRWCLK